MHEHKLVDGDGFEALHQLRSHGSRFRIAVLPEKLARDDTIESLEHGAGHYVSKPNEMREFPLKTVPGLGYSDTLTCATNNRS